MRITRLVAGTVTAGLLGLTPVAIAAPSQAANTYKTTTVAVPDKTQIEYGDETFVSLDVDAADGSSPRKGTATLQAMEAGSSNWVTVATNASARSDFLDVQPEMNTTYKVVYSGYTAIDGDIYAASQSAPFTVDVARKITYPRWGFVLEGKVKPNYGEKEIVIKVSKRKNKGFESFKTITTTSTGTYKVTLPRRGGIWYWSFTVKGDSRYAANGFLWRTWVS
jgi:hypothetical protein